MQALGLICALRHEALLFRRPWGSIACLMTKHGPLTGNQCQAQAIDNYIQAGPAVSKRVAVNSSGVR